MSLTILDNETLGYGRTAVLSEVSFALAEGERVVLLGRSGAGKSTLLNAVHDRLAPAHRVALVPQDHALVPQLSVLRNVLMGRLDDHGALYNLTNLLRVRAGDRAGVAKVLEAVGLGPEIDRPVHALSGGQRQRVALARCLVFEPRAMLLDEPLANLDLALRASMQEVFRMFHQRTRATMLYVTHDQGEALALADRVAVMERGRIRQFAAPEVLYREPADCFVAGFVGDGAVVSARACEPAPDALRIEVLGCRVPTRTNTRRPTHASIRPENIRLSHDAPLRGRITGCTYLGGRFRLTLEAAGETLTAFATQRARLGETVGLTLHDLWSFHDPEGEVLMARAMAEA